MKDKVAAPAGLMELAKLKIKDVMVLTGNRPTPKDDEYKELKASIEKDGLLNPILVNYSTAMKDGAEHYILVAGERRLQACTELGKEDIDARVLHVSQAVADEIQVVENLHRRNLTPLEEAHAFKRLAERVGESAVADIVNKPKGYVSKILGLLTLPAKVQAFITNGALTPAHGYQLLRVDDKHRVSLGDWVTTINPWTKKYPSVDELRQHIASRVEKNLKSAPWDPTAVVVVDPGDPQGKKPRPAKTLPPCVTCPQNSGNQGALFDGSQDGNCLNPSCYAAKDKAYTRDFIDAQTRRFEKFKFLGVVKDHGYMGHGASVHGARILADGDVSRAVKKAMDEHPEAFGWCVIKPSQFSQKKKLGTAVAVIDPKVMPKEWRRGQPQTQEQSADDRAELQRQQERARMIQAVRLRMVLQHLDAVYNPKNPDMEHLEAMALRWLGHVADDHAGLALLVVRPAAKGIDDKGKVVKELGKMDRLTLLRFIHLVSFTSYNLDAEAKAVGVNVKKAHDEANKLVDAQDKKKLDKAPAKS